MATPTTASRNFLRLVLVVCAVGAASGARAESRDESASTQKARRHFLIGKQAFEEKDFATALQEFEAGYVIDPRAGFLLNMGHAARRMGDQRHALDLYRRFLATDPPEDERRVAAKLVAELQREVPASSPSSIAVAAAPLPSAPDPSSAPPPTLSLVDVAPPAPIRQGQGSSGAAPIYRRWWFWAGAGGVAAGVATAILIGTLGSGSSVRDSGTWGQIRL